MGKKGGRKRHQNKPGHRFNWQAWASAAEAAARAVAARYKNKGTQTRTRTRNSNMEEAAGFRLGGSVIRVRKNKFKRYMVPLRRGLPVNSQFFNGAGVLCENLTTGYQAIGDFGMLDGPTLESALIPVSHSNAVKTLLLNAKYDVTISSSAIFDTVVTMYVLYPRTNTTRGSYQTAKSKWSDGIADAGGATTDISVYGASPYMSPELCSQFRIGRTKKFYISAGGSENIKFNFKINKVLDQASFTTNANFYMIKGVSATILFVARGVPETKVADGTQVTTSATKLIFSYFAQLNYVQPDWKGKTVSIADNMTHDPVLANWRKYAEQTGVIAGDNDI